MSESEKADTTSAIEWFFSFAAVALAVAGVLGVRGCIDDSRMTDRACRAAGGVTTSVGTASGCYRITAEPITVKP